MDSDVRYSLRLLLLAFLLTAFPLTVEAQTVRVQNDATVTVEGELDVPGDLIESGGGTFSFTREAALTLSGSSQQTVGPAVTVADLTLDNTNGAALNAAVDVSGILTLTDGGLTTNGNLTLTSDGESSSARIAGSGSGTISGDVTIERFIEYQDGSSDGSHWRFVASPLGGALDEVQGGGAGQHPVYDGDPLLSNTWTQGADGANGQPSGAAPSVFYYEESRDVSNENDGWTAVGDLTSPTSNSNISSQEGFAVYLFEDRDFDGDPDGSNDGFPRTLSATGSASNLPNINSNTSGETSLPVTCTDSDGSNGDGCNDSNDGWNLVANPFVSHFDWTSVSSTALDATAYVYDADNAEYDLYDSQGGDNFIAPFQAFFVKSNADDGNEDAAALSVGSGAKTTASGSDAEFKSVDTEPIVSLQLTDGDRAEETRLTFREGTEAGKDRFDAYQLTPLAADYHLLASEIEGRGGTYDSQYRPMPSEDSLTIDLPVTTTHAGTYTIEADTLAALPTDLQVKVVDTQTGDVANLKAGESLTFSVESGSTAPSKQQSPRELLADGPVQKTSAPGVMPDRFDLKIIPASAIPVELASFDATTEGTDVQLSWQTASETSNAGFAIERRAEGGSWSQIGFREGAGTTEQARTYRFTDTGVPFEAEQVRYRLRQKDLDGTTTLSDEVTAQLGAPSKARLHAPFPNPTTQQTTVRYEVPTTTDVDIAVYDVLGRRVETVVGGQVPAGREQRAVQTGQLAPGVYFVRMRVGDTVQTERLTVVR